MRLLQRLALCTTMFFVACTCRRALAGEDVNSSSDGKNPGDGVDEGDAVQEDGGFREPLQFFTHEYGLFAEDPFAAYARASNSRTTQPLEGA